MDYKNTDDKTGGTIRIHKKKSTTNTTNDNDSVIPQEDITLNRYELCFLIDATGSMGNYINGVRESLKILLNQLPIYFGEEIKKFVISMGLYRDFGDENQYQGVDFEKFTEKTAESGKIVSLLENVIPDGGGDAAEDIRGGLEYIYSNFSWKGKKKYIVLIADAPCHGKEYNDCLDDYPDDKGLTEIINKFINDSIFLIILELNNSTNKMVSKIKNIYEEHKKNCDHLLMVESLKDIKDSDKNIGEIAKGISLLVSGSIGSTFLIHKKKKSNNK